MLQVSKWHETSRHARETQGVQLTPLDQPQKSYRSQDASKTRQQQNITDFRLRNISAPPNQHYFLVC